MPVAEMKGKKPRIVIIGAGMAGISAAHKLLQAQAISSVAFHLTILEASNRIGGRILTYEVQGDRVELGATWIHGMEGSPLYKIADSIGATQSTAPFERQDGSAGDPVVVAEGGLIVPPSIFRPIMDVYKELLSQIRSHGKLDHSTSPKVQSIGAFVRQGFNAFLSQQRDAASLSEDLLFDCLSHGGLLSWSDYASPWTLRSLQEALISMNEYMERVETSANTLYDLDGHAEKEYADYPGEHVTIAGGYMSIVHELAAQVPPEMIHFSRRVEKIVWNRPRNSFSYPVAIYCSDGSCYEADHVILTVSLGVLKTSIQQPDHGLHQWANPELGRPVCRSLDDFEAGGLAKQVTKNRTVFEPSLPPCKVEAISRLGYGLVNKLFLVLNTSALCPSQLQQLNSHIQLVFKRGDHVRNGAIPWWMRKTFSISPIYCGSTVLLCWFAGEEALIIESLSDEEIMLGVAQTLASFGVARCRGDCVKSSSRMSSHSECSSGSDSEDSSMSRGGLQSGSSSDSDEEEAGGLCTGDDFRSMFSAVVRSKWGSNPLFYGSYSFVATGASGDDIEMLAEPLPRSRCSHRDNGNAFNGGLTLHHDSNNHNVRRPDACDTKDKLTAPSYCVSVNDLCCNRDESDNDNDAPAFQLLFAGEATVRTLYSTTHGAHLSGLREATRLLDHYNLKPSVLL